MNKPQIVSIFLLITFVTFSCKNTKKSQTNNNRYNPELAELVERMTGSFNSYRQSIDDPSYYNITLEMHRIWEDRNDGYWLYVEQAVASMKHKPYRQRVYHVTALNPRTFSSEVYTLPDEKRFIGAFKQKNAFLTFTPDSLEVREGCAIILRKEIDAFVGQTKDKECGSTLRGATYATSKVNIYKDRLESWDQGFNDQDSQVWGAVKGPYIFDKMEKIELKYPKAKREDVVDNYHGEKIKDPYRWLEDENSEETKEWVKAQNELTRKYMNNVPFRQRIEGRLKELWQFPKYSTLEEKGKYFYFFKNDGLQNHAVMYEQKGLNAQPKVFLDPNDFSDDGLLSLANHSFSKDGKYMVYGVSKGGSDWREFYVLKNGKKQKDHLKHIKFAGAAWYKDGFFYSRYEQPEEGKELSAQNQLQRIYYHELGESQEQDQLVFEETRYPKRSHSASTTSDESYLIITASEGTDYNALYYTKAKKWDKGFEPIVEDFTSNNYVIDNIGDDLLVHTDRDAPNWKLVLINPNRPKEKKWETVIAEDRNVLKDVWLAGDKIVAHYLEDVKSKLVVYSLKGERLGEIPLPSAGMVKDFSSNRDSNVVFYKFESFLSHPTVYQYNLESATVAKAIYKSDIDFLFEDYETKQVFYTSKDGTKIPMFITHHKDTELDGHNPTLLYAYGGFNVVREPEFKIENLPFYEAGGVYAVANIRGGAEYGEDWHKAGMLDKKQNVFDDFIAAAEYLIDEGYTNSEKLAVTGRSNGGLLIGAVMNQRPELFKVAMPVVGVMDMLRYQKFTIGWAWVGEYGSSDDKRQFDFLRAYSPYHNIRYNANYPSTLVLTAERDDRVVPAHSYKFTAELQHAYKGTNPILTRIDAASGHGAGGSGKTVQNYIEEYADRWAFLFWELGMFPK
ncbi:MAG: CpcT/CpeT family chromophore lyase [Chitinophagales bacterium]